MFPVVLFAHEIENKLKLSVSFVIAHNMRSLLLLVTSMVALASIEASFVNPYPRYAKYEDDGDPGEPLYLTKYIESGDLELVSSLFVRSVTQQNQSR